MHRLQISLTRSQMEYLRARARREGASIAELIRRSIEREAVAQSSRNVDTMWDIVGIGEEMEPLLGDVPVSENPDLYLDNRAAPHHSSTPKRPRRRRRKADH